MTVPQDPTIVTHASDVQQVDSSVARSPSSTGHTLTEFHLFSKLPLELRRMIFKEALPCQAGRILFLDWKVKASKDFSDLGFTFCLLGGFFALLKDSVKDLGLSLLLQLVCSEARQVYIDQNRGIFLTGHSGIIRYNPDETMVYIQDFDSIEVWKLSSKYSARKNWHREQWFTEIKHLATRAKSLGRQFRPSV